MSSVIDSEKKSASPTPRAIKKDRSIPMLPEDEPEDLPIRTGFEIERDRLAAKGLPMPVRDGKHGE